MSQPTEFYYYKIYVYLRQGAPVSGIRHHESDNLNVVKGQFEDASRRVYKENFHYLDIWGMDERFLEVEEYKKKNSL